MKAVMPKMIPWNSTLLVMQDGDKRIAKLPLTSMLVLDITTGGGVNLFTATVGDGIDGIDGTDGIMAGDGITGVMEDFTILSGALLIMDMADMVMVMLIHHTGIAVITEAITATDIMEEV